MKIDIKKAIDLFATGWTQSQVAAELKVSRQAISHALSKSGLSRWDGGKSLRLHRGLTESQIRLMGTYKLKKRWYTKKTNTVKRSMGFELSLSEWVSIYEVAIEKLMEQDLEVHQIEDCLKKHYLLPVDKAKSISITNYYFYIAKNERPPKP